jgi:hypothetical protein
LKDNLKKVVFNKNIMKKIVSRLLHKTNKEWKYILAKPKPILFDHLPKCGGTTINRYLDSVYPKRHVYDIPGNNPLKSIEKFKNLPKRKRQRYKLIYGHLANELLDFTNPEFVITTVFREPVARIVSHYHYVKRNQEHYLHEKIKDENIQLENYCYKDLSNELENWYVTHFSKMSIYEIKKAPNKAVEIALNNIINTYQVIGFQDDLPSFVKELSKVANLNGTFKNKKLNGRNNSLRTSKLDQKTYDLIYKKNSLDIELYNKLISLRERKKSKVINTQYQ